MISPLDRNNLEQCIGEHTPASGFKLIDPFYRVKGLIPMAS